MPATLWKGHHSDDPHPHDDRGRCLQRAGAGDHGPLPVRGLVGMGDHAVTLIQFIQQVELPFWAWLILAAYVVFK